MRVYVVCFFCKTAGLLGPFISKDHPWYRFDALMYAIAFFLGLLPHWTCNVAAKTPVYLSRLESIENIADVAVTKTVCFYYHARYSSRSYTCDVVVWVPWVFAFPRLPAVCWWPCVTCARARGIGIRLLWIWFPSVPVSHISNLLT